MVSLIEELKGFSGTMQYHRVTLGNLKATDGIAFLCEKAKCFWLMDIIQSAQAGFKDTGFIIWAVFKDGEGAVVKAYSDTEEDGTFSNEKLLYSQEIKHTDFPFKDLGNFFDFYQEGDVLLLKGEH